MYVTMRSNLVDVRRQNSFPIIMQELISHKYNREGTSFSIKVHLYNYMYMFLIMDIWWLMLPDKKF